MIKKNVSFFKFSTFDSGVVMDIEVLSSLTTEDMEALSASERDFVEWYREQVRLHGEVYLHLGAIINPLEGECDPLLDAPQERVCREFMEIMRAPKVPFTEL